MKNFILYTVSYSRLAIKNFYPLIILFFLWLYRIDFIVADSGGLAKGLQVVTLFGMLVYLIIKKSNIFILGLHNSNMAIKSLIIIYTLALISTLWAYIPSFSFFLSLQNLVMIFLIIYLFSINKSFKKKERCFVLGLSSIILFEAITTRVITPSGLFVHFLSAGSTAALLLSYSFAELINNKVNDKERVMYLKGSIVISTIVLITSTSSGANASAVFGLAVALFFSRHKVYAIIMVLIGILLYLNQHFIEDILLFLMPGKTMESIESGTGRINIWNEIYELAAQKPWLGWGFACIERVLSKFGQTVVDAHNNFIGFYGSLGIVGLSIYIYHCISAFIFMFKRKFRIGFSGLFAALCCVTLNGYSYGFLSGKTCSITIGYIAIIILAYSYSKCYKYSD